MNKLQTLVINQLGYTEIDDDLRCTLSDISNHGVDGGFHGFIYYTDTIKFFDDNRAVILEALAEFAEELGESVPDMVKSFRCLQISDSENWDHEIDQILMGLECKDDTQVKNALSWWAAEHVAYQLSDDS